MTESEYYFGVGFEVWENMVYFDSTALLGGSDSISGLAIFGLKYPSLLNIVNLNLSVDIKIPDRFPKPVRSNTTRQNNLDNVLD